MPEYRIAPTLERLAVHKTAKVLQEFLVQIDSKWILSPIQKSPKTSPVSPLRHKGIIPPSPSTSTDCKVQSPAHIVESQSLLRSWLTQLPLQLLEDVVIKLVDLVESDINDDKDRKIIMTLINIENANPSHFSFGIYSLLVCLAKTGVSKLPFSTRLWFCIWEFEQLTTSNHLKHCLTASIPRLNHLTHVNFAYIANDSILYLLSKHCRALEDLCLDHSSVSDRGIRFLSKWNPSDLSHSLPRSDSIPWSHAYVSSGTLSSSFLCSCDPIPSGSENSSQGLERGHPHPGSVAGCQNLKFLSLQGCSSVNDNSVWFLIENIPNLRVIRYHQSFSVAEILCKKLMEVKDDSNERALQLNLRVFDHPFPHGLNLDVEVIKQITKVCPDVCNLNLVSSDSYLPDYTLFSKLTRVALELEDCLGRGLQKFLQLIGHQIIDLTLSCSSDAESIILEGGGQPFQLFNVGLRLARRYCPNLEVFNLSGCGLVSNSLISALEEGKQEEEEYLQTNGFFKSLKSLILLTYYDDDVQVQTCEESLLFSILKESKSLECLSLEGNFSTFFGDRFLSKVMNKNPLEKLKIFDVRGVAGVPLTKVSAKSLMKLPKIRELRMYSWSLPEEQFEALKEEVKKAGWDLQLTKKASASA